MIFKKLFLSVFISFCVLFACPLVALANNCESGQALQEGVCVPCPAGHYCPNDDGSAILCPGLTYSADMYNDDEEDCDEQCSDGQFVKEDHTGCIDKCDGPNLYVKDRVCKICKTGFVFVSNSQTYCTNYECPKKYFMTEDHTTCDSCEDDKEYIEDNLCKTCQNGRVANSEHTACICPAGKYVINNKCEPCPVGYACAGDEQAVECPAGNYVDNNECKTCPAGYTCAGDGQAFKCSAGNYVANNECKTCPAGHACAGDGQAVECSGDTKYVNEGHTKCMSGEVVVDGFSCFYDNKNNDDDNDDEYICVCPDFFFSDMVGAKKCKRCPDGYMSNKDHTQCIIPQNMKFGSTDLPGELKLKKLYTNVLRSESQNPQQPNGGNQ